MGFGQIIAFIMLFFALIMISATVAMFYANSMDDIKMATDNQKLIDETIGSASIKINNTIYNRTAVPRCTLEVEVINDGKVKLDPQYIDVFINNTRIPRNASNRTITFYNGSDIINPLHFDPGERLKIVIYRNQTNSSSTLSVTTEYGSSAYKVYVAS